VQKYSEYISVQVLCCHQYATYYTTELQKYRITVSFECCKLHFYSHHYLSLQHHHKTTCKLQADNKCYTNYQDNCEVLTWCPGGIGDGAGYRGASNVLGVGRREAPVLEAAGGAEGGSVHEAGRRNPEGARHACWARSLGARRGARRWDAVGGGVSARHRAARGERPGRAGDGTTPAAGRAPVTGRRGASVRGGQAMALRRRRGERRHRSAQGEHSGGAEGERHHRLRRASVQGGADPMMPFFI